MIKNIQDSKGNDVSFSNGCGYILRCQEQFNEEPIPLLNDAKNKQSLLPVLKIAYCMQSKEKIKSQTFEDFCDSFNQDKYGEISKVVVDLISSGNPTQEQGTKVKN
jgi:hypothetical protein